MTPAILNPLCDPLYTFQQHNTAQGRSSYDHPDYFAQNHLQNQYPTAIAGLQHQYNQILSTMAAANPHEMDVFQRLSDDYRVELPGPLIGPKLSMSVLATEYAQADATYVLKTAALAQNYSAYRTVKGDGQCGWRGTVFGYFETLLQLGDLELVQQERVRLQTFEDTMRMAGIDCDIIIDMFDCTWELFDKLQKAVERHQKHDTVLLDLFDDEVKSDSIVYHFKMMTSAFMQLRADHYEPFLEVPIAEYRASRIEPSNQEIDQIGLQALTDAVIAPAQIALEVLYLDRSTGEEVTPHVFAGGPGGTPTIRLLYRPGHYDIIYKDAQQVQPTQQVFLQTASLIPQSMNMADPNGLPSDLQAYLFSGPEASQSQPHSTSFYGMDSNPHTQSRHQYIYSQHSQSSCIMPPGNFDPPPSQSMPLLTIDFQSSYPMQYPSPDSTDMSSSPHPTTPLTPTQASFAPLEKPASEPQIRLNINCYNYGRRHESMPLCTQTPGSAASLSPAHFRNQEFQPHIWIADEEYLKS